MQKRSFLALLAVTVMTVAAAAYALVTADRGVQPSVHNEPMFPGLAAHLGDLAWIRLSRGAMTADLNLIAGHWAVVEKGNYPAAAGKMRHLLLGLADLTLIEPKTARPELFGRLDLDDPSNGKATLVTAQDRTGKIVAELIVGRLRHDRLGGGDDAVYVRQPRGERAWLARGSLEMPSDTIDLLDRRLLDIAPSAVRSLTLTADDGSVLSLNRQQPGGRFAVADAPEDSQLKPDALIARPASALAALELEDVKPAAELPVPASGTATAVVTTNAGLAITLHLFRQGKTEWAAISAAGEPAAESEAAALNAKLTRWVFAIPPARAQLLRTRLADLLEPPKG